MKQSRHTESRCATVFGQKMQACPGCGGYNIGYDTPIQINEPVPENPTARQILGIYARSIKDGETMLQGPCCIRCRSCGHKGPALDCSGRTSEEVGQSVEAAAEMKRLWNNQTKKDGQ